MLRHLLTSLTLLFISVSGLLADSNYRIIITTPGYTSVYTYDNQNFEEGVKKDFRVQGNVALNEDLLDNGNRKIYVTIGMRQFDFLLTPETPVIRLNYDRNRRLFSGIGWNYLENENVTVSPPSFKGTQLSGLGDRWEREIYRRLQDRTLLDPDEPTVFILEADIDEDGNVHKLVELTGSLRQYAKVIMDEFYERAVVGWEPAKRNGVPQRSLAQIQIELVK